LIAATNFCCMHDSRDADERLTAAVRMICLPRLTING